jgi:hypothetical protein
MASQDFEIVRVISECRLIDEESFEHVYWRRDGKPLALGCYIVTWPPGARVGRFNEEAVFRGPYRQRTEALAALEEPAARAADRWPRHQPTALPRRAVGRRIASRIFLDGNTRSEPSWGGSV